MSDELRACPFCGCKEIDMWPMDGFESPVCTRCGATICENFMTGPNTERQIEAWETRTPDLSKLEALVDDMEKTTTKDSNNPDPYIRGYGAGVGHFGKRLRTILKEMRGGDETENP